LLFSFFTERNLAGKKHAQAKNILYDEVKSKGGGIGAIAFAVFKACPQLNYFHLTGSGPDSVTF
jgi:hypothetical protein